jgi:hypothetical protein
MDLLYFETSGNKGHDCAATDRAGPSPDVLGFVSFSNYYKLIQCKKKMPHDFQSHTKLGKLNIDAANGERCTLTIEAFT